ncbi:unnamed protein product [Boreogadus saida]
MEREGMVVDDPVSHWILSSRGLGPYLPTASRFPKVPGHPREGGRAAPALDWELLARLDEAGPGKGWGETKDRGSGVGECEDGVGGADELGGGASSPPPEASAASRPAGRGEGRREQEHLAPPPFPGELGDRGSHSGGAAAPQITSGVSAHCSPPARATP